MFVSSASAIYILVYFSGGANTYAIFEWRNIHKKHNNSINKKNNGISEHLKHNLDHAINWNWRKLKEALYINAYLMHSKLYADVVDNNNNHNNNDNDNSV